MEWIKSSDMRPDKKDTIFVILRKKTVHIASWNQSYNCFMVGLKNDCNFCNGLSIISFSKKEPGHFVKYWSVSDIKIPEDETGT